MHSNGDSAKLGLEDKRESFRVQIRRQTLDDMLRKRRAQIQQLLPPVEVQFTPKLLSHEDRENLVKQCSLALSGFPSQDWLDAIVTISHNIASFQGNYEALIESHIVYNICQLLKPENDAIGWRVQAARLLTDLICSNKSVGLVSKILDYDILKDLCRILTNKGQPIDMLLYRNYLYLLGNIAGDNIKARNATIVAGGVPILKQLLDQATDEFDVELLMWMVSNFVKSDDYEEKGDKLLYNTVSVFLPHIEKFIVSNHENILTNCLYSLVFLLSERSYKVSNIYHCQTIRKRLLQLACHPARSVRAPALRALASLCSTNNNHFVTNLLQEGLLDEIYRAITTFEQSRRQKLLFLWICENVIKNSNEDLFTLIHHQCFSKLVAYAHPQEEHDVRGQALSTLRVLFEFCAYAQAEYVLRFYPDLLAMFVHSITTTNEPADIVLRTLKCLLALVRLYHGVYTPIVTNKIVSDLERSCHIENVMDELTRHPNAQIQKVALELANFIGQCDTEMIM